LLKFIKEGDLMGLEDLKAIDIMNYPNYDEEGKQLFFTGPESGLLMKTAAAAGIPPAMSTEDYVKVMDEAGYEKVFLCALKMGSYRHAVMNIDYDLDWVYERVKKFPDRLIGIAGYNPMYIMDSLNTIEKAVKEYGFKGVYAHTYGWDMGANDRRMYPVYAKCAELGIPFSMQIGQSYEPLPMDAGRPVYLNQPALDFPEVNFVCSHTAYPWVEECVSMAWTLPNVYIDTSAHAPKSLMTLMKPLLDFMNAGAGRSKVIYGTNGFPLKMAKDMFMSLPLKEETIQAVMHDNAARLYKL